MQDQRSAPTGLTNAICNTCKAVTTHQHGDCIACTRYKLDGVEDYHFGPLWTINDERRSDILNIWLKKSLPAYHLDPEDNIAMRYGITDEDNPFTMTTG